MPPKRCPKCNKYMSKNVHCKVCGYSVPSKSSAKKAPAKRKKRR